MNMNTSRSLLSQFLTLTTASETYGVNTNKTIEEALSSIRQDVMFAIGKTGDIQKMLALSSDVPSMQVLDHGKAIVGACAMNHIDFVLTYFDTYKHLLPGELITFAAALCEYPRIEVLRKFASTYPYFTNWAQTFNRVLGDIKCIDLDVCKFFHGQNVPANSLFELACRCNEYVCEKWCYEQCNGTMVTSRQLHQCYMYAYRPHDSYPLIELVYSISQKHNNNLSFNDNHYIMIVESKHTFAIVTCLWTKQLQQTWDSQLVAYLFFAGKYDCIEFCLQTDPSFLSRLTSYSIGSFDESHECNNDLLHAMATYPCTRKLVFVLASKLESYQAYPAEYQSYHNGCQAAFIEHCDVSKDIIKFCIMPYLFAEVDQ